MARSPTLYPEFVKELFGAMLKFSPVVSQKLPKWRADTKEKKREKSFRIVRLRIRKEST